MKLKDWLEQAVKKLADAEIASAQLDALILLEDQLHKDRAYLLAHPEMELSTTAVRRLDRKIDRRTNDEPLAYIRGFTEFYGRKFKVNRHVLEPRPESETMVELLLKTSGLPEKPVMADIGTGSGAIGITVRLELESQVDLYDIDSACLAVARHNALLHELHLHCFKRDLLNRPARNYDVILANLPYIPNHWQVHRSTKMEPRLALNGGAGGLDLYRRLFAQATRASQPPKFILTESMPPQHPDLSNIAAGYGYRLVDSQDFIQVFKLS